MLLHVSILRSSPGRVHSSLLKLYVKRLITLLYLLVMRQHIVCMCICCIPWRAVGRLQSIYFPARAVARLKSSNIPHTEHIDYTAAPRTSILLQHWTTRHITVTPVLRSWRWTKDCQKHVELIQRSIKLSLLHLVGNLYYSPKFLIINFLSNSLHCTSPLWVKYFPPATQPSSLCVVPEKFLSFGMTLQPYNSEKINCLMRNYSALIIVNFS